MKSVIEKVETQENKIAEIEAAIKNLPGNTPGIEEIKNVLESIKEIVESISFPIQEMKELSKSVTECRKQLSQPVQNSVQHHHHFPKIAWLIVVLFLALTIVCPGWYMTGTTLKEYKANDTKYRFLKLYGNNSLKETLFTADSLYRVYPGMRDSVIQKENEDKDRFEMLQNADNKENEAKELRKKAKGR
jgi:hypothetical protein